MMRGTELPEAALGQLSRSARLCPACPWSIRTVILPIQEGALNQRYLLCQCLLNASEQLLPINMEAEPKRSKVCES